MKREKFIKLLKSNIKLMKILKVNEFENNEISLVKSEDLLKLKELILDDCENDLCNEYEYSGYFLKKYKEVPLATSSEYTKITDIIDGLSGMYGDYYFKIKQDCYGHDIIEIYQCTSLNREQFEKFVKKLEKEVDKIIHNNVKELKLSKEEMKECVKRAAKDVQTLPPWKDPSKNKRGKK